MDDCPGGGCNEQEAAEYERHAVLRREDQVRCWAADVSEVRHSVVGLLSRAQANADY